MRPWRTVAIASFCRCATIRSASSRTSGSSAFASSGVKCRSATAVCSLEVGRLADLDAVTLDANGTLIGLVDPVPKLDRLLRERGFVREPDQIRRAFEAEGVVYAGRAAEAHEPAALATMQRDCTSVFLEEAGVELDPSEFATSYVAAMEFEVLP